MSDNTGRHLPIILLYNAPPSLLLPPPLSYRSQTATGGQCSAIAGSSGSAANREEDGYQVALRVVAQGPGNPSDKPHQQKEEGGVFIQDGNGDGGRCRGVAPGDLKSCLHLPRHKQIHLAQI